MTRDVLISISGVHLVDDDNGETQMITAGDYFQKNGSHYILYEEVQEGIEGVIKNTIKVGDNGLDIIKRGNSSVHMTFERDKKTNTCYITPYGEMMIGIQTKDIQIREKEDSLKVSVGYSLDINYQHVSECNIILDVQSKASASIHLSS